MADDLAFIDVGSCEPQPLGAAADPLVPRPPFARWLFERDIEDKDAAERLGCSRQTIWSINLPFSDPRRTKPRRALAERIEAWTAGLCPRASFDPPVSGERLP